MKRLLLISFSFAPLFLAPMLLAGDAELLAGKWSVKKITPQWHGASQTMEIKGKKFAFEVLDSDDHLVLHAEGELKLEKLGTFNLARFIHVRAGESASNLEDIDDEFNSIYTIDGDTWTMASNFDKDRDQKPSLEAYQRVAAPQAKTLV